MPTTNVEEIFDNIAKDFKKKYKEYNNTICSLEEELPPTGLVVDNPALEFLLDRRYLPFGRFYLAYGNKSNGKTSMFFELTKIIQSFGGYSFWIETENAADKAYAAKQGVDLTRVKISHPDTFEEALSLAETIIENIRATKDNDIPFIIGLDSIAGTMTDYDEKAEVVGAQRVGDRAAKLTNFYQRCNSKLATEKIIFLATNQVKQKIGGFGFGEEAEESLPGGKAQTYYSTYQWKMSKIGELSENIKNQYTNGVASKSGSIHEIKVVRNKLGREGKTRTMRVNNYAKGGFDWYTPLIDALAEEYTGIVTKSGKAATWKIPGVTYIDPEDNQEKEIECESQLAKKLAQKIANSNTAKDIIRDAFEIPEMPTLEVIEKAEAEIKKKRGRPPKTEKLEE